MGDSRFQSRIADCKEQITNYKEQITKNKFDCVVSAGWEMYDEEVCFGVGAGDGER